MSRTLGDHSEAAWINDFVLGVGMTLVFHAILFRRWKEQFHVEHGKVFSNLSALLVAVIAGVGGFLIIRYAGNVELAKLKDPNEPITFFTSLVKYDPNKSSSYLMAGYAWMAFVLAGILIYRKLVLQLESKLTGTFYVVYLIAVLFTMAGVTYLNSWADDYPEGDSDFSLFEIARYAYILIILVIGLYQRKDTQRANWEMSMTHIGILWLLSLELIHWSLIWKMGVGYKLILSLLWGSYAIFLLIRGLKMKLPVLRITAMSVLGVMLVKLFFYDLTMLSTITKTLVFLMIGGLLLLGGYFYQRISKQEEG
jgi:uncharacterized membrane protein